MTGGLVMFFVEYLVQAGLFFTIPLFLSVALGLSALETGIRILPLSITLLAAAIGIPGSSPLRPRAGWCAWGCWPCWPGSSSCLPPSTPRRTPGS
jgi:hypothetical protein